MTLEDRERNFEKALGRELRAKGASGLDCPDTETLAAYHERMLSPEEMSAQKTHIAACPRCQEILATLEVTEAIPSGAEDSEKVQVKTTDLAGAKAKSATLREMPKRKVYIRWAVPAGAIAAGLLVWIAINSSRPAMMSKQTASVQIAENREQKEAPVSAPKPETKAPASSSMADRVAMDEQLATKQEAEAYADGSGDRAKALNKTQEETMSRGRAGAVPRAYSRGPRQLQNQANQTQNEMLYRTQNNGQIVARNQATESDKLSEVPSAGKNATALEQNAPQRNERAMMAAPAAPPPAPAAGTGASGGKPTEAAKRKDTDMQTATQMVEVTGADASVSTDLKADKEAIATKKQKPIGGLAGANVRDTSAGGLQFVQTPDAKVLWFFTANGKVFRSDDGGNTTRVQKIAAGIKFLAGSAPDAKTCWLLAEKGIVLRTKDGGKRWITVTAPADGNFTMITGLDAMSALITEASGRVSYSTTDGGATWKVVAQPQQ